MKRFFDFELYRQGIRKSRVLGIIGLITTALFTLINPTILLIQLSPLKDEYSQQDPTVFPFLIIAVPMLTILLFAPLLVSNIFSFLRKRSHSDFYHSLPHSKECMFISFFSSCLTWVLATIVIVSAAAIAIYSALPAYVVFDLWDVISCILGIFSFAFLLMSLSAFAVSITGTAFAWFATFAVILTAIPLYVSLILSSVSTLIPSFDGMAFFTEPLREEVSAVMDNTDFNVFYILSSPLSLIFYSSELTYNSVEYSVVFALLLKNFFRIVTFLVLGAGITALSCFVYRKRLSEWAGRPMPNEKFRKLLTSLFALPFLLIATHYLLSFLMSAYPHTYLDFKLLPIICIMLLISVAAWCGAEFITSRSVTKSIISIPRYLILIGICGVYAAFCLCVRGSLLSFRPTADSVAGVKFEAFEDHETISEYAAIPDNFISDPDVINYVCYHLDVSTSELVRAHKWSDDIITQKVVFKMKSGATVTRDVCLPGSHNARDILLLALGSEDGYTKAVTALPEAFARTSVLWHNISYSSSQSALIWETFCKEYSETSFEEKALCKYMAFDDSISPVITVYDKNESDDPYGPYPVSCKFGVPASFTRTRQLMIDLVVSSSDYSGERLLDAVYNDFNGYYEMSAVTFSEPYFSVIAEGKELFVGTISERNVSNSIIESIFTALMYDDVFNEKAAPQSTDSYIAVKINVTQPGLQEGSYGTCFYAVSENTAKYIADCLNEMQE